MIEKFKNNAEGNGCSIVPTGKSVTLEMQVNRDQVEYHHNFYPFFLVQNTSSTRSVTLLLVGFAVAP